MAVTVALSLNACTFTDQSETSNMVDESVSVDQGGQVLRVNIPNGDGTFTTLDGEEAQKHDCTLKRGVTVLQLDSRQEPRPDYIKAFKYQISGNCGNVFNPSTGHCLKAEPLTRTYDISGDKYKGSTLRFTIYFFLGDDDVSDIKLTTQSVDTYDKTVKDLSFENVHMVQGKMTIYKGPFLSTHSAASFLIDSPTIPGSGFNIEF